MRSVTEPEGRRSIGVRNGCQRCRGSTREKQSQCWTLGVSLRQWEELKKRDAGTNGVTGKRLLREAEQLGSAERSPMARVAGRFSAQHVHIDRRERCANTRRALSRLGKNANRNLMRFNEEKWGGTGISTSR